MYVSPFVKPEKLPSVIEMTADPSIIVAGSELLPSNVIKTFDESRFVVSIVTVPPLLLAL